MKKSQTRASLIFLFLITCMVMQGCGIKYRKAVNSAEAIKDAYPLIQLNFASAYKDKTISKEQWDNFVTLDAQIIAKQNKLVDTLKLYNAAKRANIDTGKNLDAIVLLHNELLVLYSDVLHMASEYGVDITGRSIQ